jgi:hypothetical protein
MNQRIRNKLAGYMLVREIRRVHRVPRVIAFDKAKTIGIIYDATRDQDFELMKNYVRDIRGIGKDVVSLGYFNQKELPGMRFMKLGLDLFTKKSLDWKMKPHSPVVSSFLQRDFDILICFNLVHSVPLSYITAHSKAVFKIGKYDSRFSGLFDFMIKPESTPSLKQMMDQVNHYLTLIRNENKQTT